MIIIDSVRQDEAHDKGDYDDNILLVDMRELLCLKYNFFLPVLSNV